MSADLKAIQERAEKATPGPWKDELDMFSEEEGRLWTVFDVRGPADMLVKIIPDDPQKLEQVQRDGQFIAHARTDIPALLEHISRREEVVRMLTEALGKLEHRKMADGQPCWCLLWPDEEPETTLAEEGHCAGCLASRAALKAASEGAKKP